MTPVGEFSGILNSSTLSAVNADYYSAFVVQDASNAASDKALRATCVLSHSTAFAYFMVVLKCFGKNVFHFDAGYVFVLIARVLLR